MKINWNAIKLDYENGMTTKELSEKYGVKKPTIQGRINRCFWERKQEVKRTWSKDRYNLSRCELIESVNVCIQFLTTGKEYEFVEWIRNQYPHKKLSYKTIGRIRQLARKRIAKQIDIEIDSAIKEYLIKLDTLYRKALEIDDLKTSLDVLKERAKLIDLYPIPKSKLEVKTDYDIDADIENRIKQFDELNERLEREMKLPNITPPTLEEIMNG